ncbi:unnamed protein product [Somion occarium]|uniref:DUF159-domain-containing protein n=1 Tax=Somion occarium TaxID=3059160 RepID=A0ABP1CQU4_9APHY
MCGRFALAVPHAAIQALDGYDIPIGEWIDQDQFVPRYNIAPRSTAPVVRRHHTQPPQDESSSSSASSVEPVLHTMRWGLVPHWSKHEDKSLSTMNARRENLVAGGGMWASIKGRKRCAVPCQGYYEWLKKGKERIPHFIKRKDGHLMLLAGLYDCAHLEGESEPLWTFTVVTTDANKELNWLHDRQPVILPNREAVLTWLDTSPQKWTPELTKLVQPHRDEDAPLICYPVPKEVGKVGTESPTFIEPIAERKDGIQAMFAKQTKPSETISQPSTPSKGKKRERSPSFERLAKTEAKDEKDVKPAKKKRKVEKMNTWEDDSDIEYVEGPSETKKSPPKGSQEKKPTKSVGKKPAAKKERKGTKTSKEESKSPEKITTFLKK